MLILIMGVYPGIYCQLDFLGSLRSKTKTAAGCITFFAFGILLPICLLFHENEIPGSLRAKKHQPVR